MKFDQLSFHETSAEFFEKQGMSWHGTVLLFRNPVRDCAKKRVLFGWKRSSEKDKMFCVSFLIISLSRTASKIKLTSRKFLKQ